MTLYDGLLFRTSIHRVGRRTIGGRAPTVVNRQSAVRVPIAELERFLTRARRKLRVPVEAVTVCFVTSAQMARWNKEFRRKRGPTDVLSFPADNGNANDVRPVTNRGSRPSKSARGCHYVFGSSDSFFSHSHISYLGDIAIAPAVARANARRFGRTLANELRILILHGVIHLMGYDHETDHGEMDRLEQSLRRSLGL